MQSKVGISTDVICFGAPKDAALYFDRVFPFDTAIGALPEKARAAPFRNYIPFDDIELTRKILNSLFGGENKNAVIAYIRQIPAFLLSNALTHAVDDEEYRNELLDDKKFESLKKFSSMINIDFTDALEKTKGDRSELQIYQDKISTILFDSMEKTGFDLSCSWDATGIPDFGSLEQGDEGHYVAILSQLPLIDVEKISWDQIIELRKDAASLAALQRFRAFFSENYANKDLQFIKDDLLSRIDAQETVAKMWGMSTATRSLGAAVSDRSILMSTLSAFFASSGGASNLLTALAGGAAIIGNVGIEIQRARMDRKVELLGSPLTFLTNLRKSSITE